MAEGSQRHALLVGASRGLGLALADALVAEGWRVTTASRSPVPGHAWRRADVSDPAQATALARACEPVDALVFCVGDFHRARVTEESPAAWRAAFASNVDPFFHLSAALLPGMKARGWGRILSFTVAGRPSAELAAYQAAKAALLALTRSLAQEGAAFGVTANAIAPGLLESSTEDERARMAPRVPARRPGAIAEVVATARFLLSDAAAYTNGAEIPVSGGLGL